MGECKELQSGAISQADAKASSQAVNYQDVMPDLEPVSFEDDDPASKDDEPEDPASSFEVDMSAIGRVHQHFRCFLFNC